MSTARTLARKEIGEYARTWRIWVVSAAFLFFALTSPVVARIAPDLIGSLAEGQSGVVLQLPPPTWRDSYDQWIKNLSQIGMLVLVVVASGIVAGERSSGTAAMVLAKPVSRRQFVVVKATTLALAVMVTAALGSALVQIGTRLIFGASPASVLWSATAVWVLAAWVVVAVTTLLSCCLPTMAAAGCALGAYLVLSALTISSAISQFTLVGLLNAPAALVAGASPALGWPVSSGLLAVALLLVVASSVFSHRDL